MTQRSADTSGHLLHNLLLFGRVLRRLGLDVHTGRMLDVVEALDHVGLRRKRDFFQALRTLLVHRRQDLARFDEAFEVFWRAHKDGSTPMDLRSMGEQRRYRQPQVSPPPPGSDAGVEGDEGESGPDVDRVDLTRTYSPREVLRTKDFSRFTDDELGQAREMMAEMSWDVGTRRTRRWIAGRGRAPDLRRMIRRNMAYGGELIELPSRRRRDKARPLILICDVSGSMESYTRLLLHFTHAVFGGLGRMEAFMFATRLTRITGYLSSRDVDRAVADVSHAVPDWAGGTRIGEAVKVFNHQWARRVLGWGSVVLIISDGWDRGEPDLLRHEIARLQRSCHRLIWLNPLLGSPTYEPLARGMQAALPFVDDFLPVHNLSSLEDLAGHLNGLSRETPARRQQSSVWLSTTQAPEPEPEPSPPARPSSNADANPTFRHPMWGRGNG